MSEHPFDLIERATRLRAEQTDDAPSFQELVGVDMETEELAELWLILVEYQRAARNVVAALAAELGTKLEASGNGVEIMDQWVFFKKKRTSRIADAEGFWEWMKANPEYLEAAFNPNTMRKTGIPASILDTFFEQVEKPEPEVSSVPIYVLERNKAKKEAKS